MPTAPDSAMAARVREEDQGDDLAMIAQPANLDSPLLAVVQRVDSDHSMPSGDYTGLEAGESQDAAVMGQVSQPADILTLAAPAIVAVSVGTSHPSPPTLIMLGDQKVLLLSTKVQT